MGMGTGKAATRVLRQILEGDRKMSLYNIGEHGTK